MESQNKQRDEVMNYNSSDVEDGEIPDDNGKDQISNFVFEIKFGSQTFAEKFQNRVSELLQPLLSKEALELKCNNNDGIPSIRIVESDPIDDINLLFQIDAAPSEKLETANVPSYKRTIKDVLDEETKVKESEDQCKRPKLSSACFNCGETDHSLRECTKPRNANRINRAKKQHISYKTERYHVDKEQRFGHIRAGAVSANLRKALGIRSGEIPFFFYRMRVFGYPPGWFEDAKTQSSGIALLNADGTDVNQNGDEQHQEKIDVKKLIDFPGFNVDPGRKFYDDYKYHGVPPLNANQSKQAFIESLGNNAVKGYKRKKLIKLPLAHDDQETDSNHINDNCIADDMDLDESCVEIVDSSGHSDTVLTIEDDGFGEENPNIIKQEISDLETIQNENVIDLSSSEAENTEDTNKDNSKEDLIELGNANGTPQKDAVFLETHAGTPILKFSPYNQLPDQSKFKIGVSDVIYFDNLPDATGKYDQMKEVLKKVRQTIATQQSDKEDD